MSPNTRGAILGLLGFGIFSIHDVIVKYLGATYSPFQILFFSVLFAFPMISFMLVRDSLAGTMRPHHPWWTALRTLSLLISGGCGFYAFSVLPLTQTYSILFAVPLVITLLAIPMLGEKVGLHRGGAVLIGLIGVLIVVRPGASEITSGHAAAFVTVFFSSLASVIVRRVGKEERNLVLLMFPMLASFVVMGALMPLDYKPMPLNDLIAIAALSVLGFVALNFMIIAYQTGEAAVVAPMQYSQMLWATLYGFLIFSETPEQHTLIGAAVIIASGLYIVFRESRKNVSDNTPVLRARSRVTTGTLPNRRSETENRDASDQGQSD